MQKSVFRSRFLPSISNSLPVRAWCAVAIVMVMAVGMAMVSGILAWIAQSDAEAVNTAGSMRMATYRINYLVVKQENRPAQTPANAQALANQSTNHESQVQSQPQIQPEIQSQQLLPNDALSRSIPASQPIDSHLSKDELLATLTQDMQSRLAQLAHYEQSQGNRDDQINQQIDTIRQIWTTELQPTLETSVREGNSDALYAISLRYIDNVDKLVKQIQTRNEHRQSLQQNLQIGALLLTIIIMLAGLHEIQQNVLIPVGQLRKATQQFGKGEDTSVNIAGYEEFNELGDSFNQMTSTLKAYQNNLEAEVAKKTYHLTQSNQALTLLYDFAKQLNQQPVAYARLQVLIEQFGAVLPNFDISLCLHDANLHNDNFKDAMAMHSLGIRDKRHLGRSFCHPAHCQTCDIKHDEGVWVYPINSLQTQWGELLVKPRHHHGKGIRKQPQPTNSATSQKPSPINRITLLDEQNWQNFADSQEPFFDENELLNTLANLIGLMFAGQKQREQEHQLILSEERNTMARELHDSLAQSLSYLKMQVSMLTTLLKDNQNPNNHKIEQVLSQTKDGLNGAYSQLRELLATFRLKIEEGSFDTALAQAGDEFANKGGFAVHLDNRLMSINLTATEQVDLLQITREALSNINRHAQAKNAHISLSQNQQGVVSLHIQDDGVGLQPKDDGQHHYGMTIMQERSHSLGGECQINNVLPHGTAVRVQFLPQAFQQKIE